MKASRLWRLGQIFLIALAIGVGLTSLYRLFPVPFRPPADVLGNAHYWNIDIDRFFRAYSLWVLWPLVSILLCCCFLRKNFNPRAVANGEEDRQEQYKAISLFPMALCFALLLPLRWTPWGFGVQTLVVASLLTLILSRLSHWAIYLTPISWFAVYRFSSLSGVLLPQAFIPYPWLSPSVLTAIIVIHVSLLMRYRPNLSRAVFLSSVPILIYLLHAYLPGELGEMDFSHDGELVSSAELLTKGYLPWRDLVLSHGFLSTQFTAWVGFEIFEKSRWGLWAGQYIVIAPVYWVALYLFSLYFFRRNRLFLLAFNLILPFILPNLFRREFFRCVLLLPTYILFHRFLLNAKWTWALSAAALAILQALVTIEAGFIIPAIALAVIVYDALIGTTGQGFWARWERTLKLGLSGVGLFILFCGVLYATGSLNGFINTYMTWGGNYRYFSAIEPSFPSGNFMAAAFIPLGLILITPLWVYLRWSAKCFLPKDGVMLCVYVVIALYYQKYLNRMDQHVYHVYIVAFPLLLFYLFEMVQFAERQMVLRRFPQVISLVLFGWLCTYPYSWADRISQLPDQFRVRVKAAPEVARVGFADSQTEKPLVADFERFFADYLEPNEPIFDFANQGGLFYFLLGRVPASRYYYVLNAIRRDAQREVIADLERARPRFVVFAYPRHWTARMDEVPLFIRYYEVSKYIQRNYVPFAKLHERYLYRRNDLPPIAVKAPLEKLNQASVFEFASCDWGYAAQHFSREVSEDSQLASESLYFEKVRPNESSIILSSLDNKNVEAIDFEFSSVGNDRFEINDGGVEQNRKIRFWTKPSPVQRIRISVSSCPQWYGYSKGRLVLRSDSPHTLLKVTAILKGGRKGVSLLSILETH